MHEPLAVVAGDEQAETLDLVELVLRRRHHEEVTPVQITLRRETDRVLT